MKFAARFLISPLVVSLAAGVSAQNLLSDGGFETPFVTEEMNAQLPDPGSPWNGFGNAFIATDNNQQSGGFQALKMFQGFTGGFNVGAGALQMVPVTPGTTYEMSCLLRNGPDVSAFMADPLSPGNFIVAKIEWFDSSMQLMAAYEDRANMMVDWNDTQFQWMSASIVDIAPPGAAFAQAVFLHFYDDAQDDDPSPGSDNGGSSWADDVVLEVTSEVTPEAKADNLLTNGGFETTTAWMGFGNAFQFENEPATDFGTYVIRGLGCAYLFQTFPTSGEPPIETNEANTSGWFQDVSGIVPGETYSLTAAARNGNGFGADALAAGNSAVIKIEWLDSSDQIIAGEAVEDPVNGGIDSSTPPIEFQQLGIEGVAPSGAVKARIFVLHTYDGTGTVGANGGSSWFDDLCFRQGALPEPPKGPEIKSIVWEFDEATITFPTEEGKTYRLLKSTTLEPGSFAEVFGEDNIVGDGFDYMAVDFNAIESEAFYVVEELL